MSKMVTCGHQFHMGDECDWLISSSAVCPINGNLSATKILKELIEAHCKTRKQGALGEIKENKNDTNKMRLPFDGGHEYFEEGEPEKLPQLILEAKEIPLTMQKEKKKTGNRSGGHRPLPRCYDSDDFDENQHLDGCPVKWFYRKRTKDGWGPCVALNRNSEGGCEEGKSGKKKFRDRIPLEVKIGKISLNKRQSFAGFRNVSGKKHELQSDLEKCRKFEIDPKLAEIQKKKLEAKLNWRPFQEDFNDGESELSYDRSSRNGYLRAKSALGGKLPVSILLFPYQQQNCFCGRGSHQEVSEIRVERMSSAGQNAKSSEDAVPSSKVSRPKTAQFLRWGSKTQRKGKRLQLPKQLNVLFDAPKKRHSRHSANLPGIKRQTEKATRACKRNSEDHSTNNHRLTSLYYELEDKSNSGKLVDDEYLEKMIRELSMEDNLRGIRNILNPGFPVKKKKLVQGKDCQCSVSEWSDDDHFKIICKQMKFSKRTPKGRSPLDVEAPVPGPVRTEDSFALQRLN